MIKTLSAAALAALTFSAASSASDLSAPDAFTFGSGLDAMTSTFATLCERHDVRELDPAELPIAQSSHVQVDCHGFSHAGDTRLAEFVFADDALAFVWVLTRAEEEAGFLERLTADMGTPSHDTPMFVAFADYNMALRRDIPEFLYYGDHIAPMYRAWFDQMAAQ